MMNFMRLLLIALLTTLTACADMQTVGRKTTLPYSPPSGVLTTGTLQDDNDVQGKNGVAIHLDAQQRLVMFHLNKYCAEPSPDALASYAASLGFGISNSSKNAASLAQGIQSAAGSIGLRTQSITLMRDALYRMCEAANNGNLDSVQVSRLLHQSQDLTAVVLAVEQLTGAVTTNQIVLDGTTSSDATSSLVSNQQALDSVRKSEATKKTDFENATKAKQAAEKVVADKDVELKAAQGKLDALPTDAKQPDRDAATTARDKKQSELNLAQNDLKTASEQYELSKKIYADAVALTQQIEAQKDAAMANANASTSTSGHFAPPTQRIELTRDKDATIAIAATVKEMVLAVLEKDYSDDVCLGYLITHEDSNEATNPIDDAIKQYENERNQNPAVLKKLYEKKEHKARAEEACRSILKKKADKEERRLLEEKKAKNAPDEQTLLLQLAILRDSPKDIAKTLHGWLTKLQVLEGTFLNSPDYAIARKIAVNELLKTPDTTQNAASSVPAGTAPN